MKPAQADPHSVSQRIWSSRAWLAAFVGAFFFGLGGCVGEGYVGVSTYPSYAPYYSYYGYSGAPYYGYRGIYARNIIVRGRRHPSSFGRHHYWRDRRQKDRPRSSRPGGSGRRDQRDRG